MVEYLMLYTYVGLEDKKILIAHFTEGADCMLPLGDGKVIFRPGSSHPAFGKNGNPTKTWRKRFPMLRLSDSCAYKSAEEATDHAPSRVTYMRQELIKWMVCYIRD